MISCSCVKPKTANKKPWLLIVVDYKTFAFVFCVFVYLFVSDKMFFVICYHICLFLVLLLFI